MFTYTLTAYEKDGTKLIDEVFEAENDELARYRGENKLIELGLSEKTSRVTSRGKLIHFHR
ncbi:YhzD family protein [Pullulanibacillus sp. KACC 23026]|uniref:YhzD family protein n=1 Tax=Pullulanibacillus sp. KACC 23026 TaxID=3028315 RepID=UPI0023B0C219|nr:YhzD family protein [Pullulanibacillus sp. KACC 23026]WEG12046.1 YhzD family protein [Pullulanibacillus sp. KACC 23026]